MPLLTRSLDGALEIFSSAAHTSAAPNLVRHNPRNNDGNNTGSGAKARIIYTAVSLFCMLVLATMLGTRIRSLRSRKQLANMTFIRALVYFLYFLGIAFVTSAATLESGLDLSTLGSCRAAIYICLLFYVGSKVVMQIFLVERAHAIRYKLKRRMDDYVWLVGILIVLFGFGSIAIVAFISPIADIARSDGKCRIGLPLKVTIPLLTYDILINVAMTFVFVALLRPLLRFRTPPDGRGPTVVVKHDPKKPGTIVRPLAFSQIRSCRSSAAIHSMSAQSIELQDAPPPRDVVINPQLRILKRLVMKSLLGAVAVLVPTIVNLGLLYHWSGEEQGWLCFTICTCDVTWQVTVVHFLTVDPSEEDRGQPAVMNATGVV